VPCSESRFAQVANAREKKGITLFAEIAAFQGLIITPEVLLRTSSDPFGQIWAKMTRTTKT
jgi:hypothetical protein